MNGSMYRPTASPHLLAFDPATVFRSTYQRNNKKGGQKNLRCFPNCCQGMHANTGFCGGPVAVRLEQKDKKVLLFAEFVPRFKDLPQATMTIGERYTLELLKEKSNKERDPLVPYFAGHNMQTAYYFNPSKKGWHYGWMSNKHTSDREHVLIVHLLEEIDDTYAVCIDSLASPPFTVHCRRRSKVDSPPAGGTSPSVSSPATSSASSKKRPLATYSSASPTSPSSDEDAIHTKRQMISIDEKQEVPEDDDSLGLDTLFQEEVLDLITSSTPSFNFGLPMQVPTPAFTFSFVPVPAPTNKTLWDTLLEDEDDSELLAGILPSTSTPSAPPMYPRNQVNFPMLRNSAPRRQPRASARIAAAIPIDLKHPNGQPPVDFKFNQNQYPIPQPNAPVPSPPSTAIQMPVERRCSRSRGDSSAMEGRCSRYDGHPAKKGCCLLWNFVQLVFCLTMFIHFCGHIFYPGINFASEVNPKSSLIQYLVDCPPPSTNCLRDGFGLSELTTCVSHIADRCAKENTSEIVMYFIDGNNTQINCAGMDTCASQLSLYHEPKHQNHNESFHGFQSLEAFKRHKEGFHQENDEFYMGMQHRFVMFMGICTLISFLAMQRSFRKFLKRFKAMRGHHHRRHHPDEHIAYFEIVIILPLIMLFNKILNCIPDLRQLNKIKNTVTLWYQSDINWKLMKKALNIASVRGTRDLWPNELQKHLLVTNELAKMAQRYGFAPVQTPTMESTDLFHRSLGDGSDIVMKEMYTFQDNSQNSITLRPEGTAGVIRSMISSGLQYTLPHKVYYQGSMFRYERPQRGRYREFQQFGVEYIGSAGPSSDIEVISLARDSLERIGLVNDVSLEINTLGCHDSRQRYRQVLEEFLGKYRAELSVDSQQRLDRKSVLRILDSKCEHDQEILQSAPRLQQHLSDDARKRFDDVLSNLAALGIECNLNDGLVRGLDYYSHTVFEFVEVKEDSSKGIAVLAGGCYDDLVSMLGGPATSCVGWAAGVERLCLLSTLKPPQSTTIAIVPVCAGDKIAIVRHEALRLAKALRDNGRIVHFCDAPNMKKQMKMADNFKCSYAILLGENEMNTGKVVIKHLQERKQQEVALADITSYLSSSTTIA
ncbi:histidyl-tRNA synthase [Thraustotheca clavata]|uniref:histidine--tRNA ligase n=1 Tax=Thraustotheca clavata TaxID=74557 RepID=A0A1V9Z783_9STRA|nr:histidyl-tRNA synthase [Thraustotheca clavata]